MQIRLCRSVGIQIIYLLSSVILVEFLNASSKELVTTNDFFSGIASKSPGTIRKELEKEFGKVSDSVKS